MYEPFKKCHVTISYRDANHNWTSRLWFTQR